MNIILSYFMDVTRNLASHPLRTSTTLEGGLLRTCVQTGCAPISSLHGYYITFLQGWLVHHPRPHLPPMFAGWPSSSLFGSKVFPRGPISVKWLHFLRAPTREEGNIRSRIYYMPSIGGNNGRKRIYRRSETPPSML